MKKLLYIDLPFIGERGGDKNRSKFIWNAITNEFEIDLLLIRTYKDKNKDINAHDGCKDQYFIETKKSGKLSPESIFSFPKKEIKKFKGILRNGNYDIIFIRFASPSRLADIAGNVLPKTKIIIDIDMLFSRLSELSWKTNPTLKNRFFFIENKRLKKYEKKLFNKPYLFLFTNYIEKEIVEKKYVKPASKGVFKILPNVMKETLYLPPEKREQHILFFGALNSAANVDAFSFIAKDIYKLISHKLEEKKVHFHIVGKNQTAIFKQYITEYQLKMVKIVGEVDDMNASITESLFVVLPIRIASGTRTRILEAGNLRTAVISTTIGAEGFTFEKDELIIEDTAEGLAKAIIQLLNDPKEAEQFGEKLYKKSRELYLDTNVAKNLIHQIREY